MSNPTPTGVVTRFAPSPTGFLHIGGARTALFNWLYARHTGGKFLIRVEDTDRERSTEAAVAAIFEGLDWLGLKSDDEVVFQHTRAPRHVEVVHELLAKGRAYRCWMSVEELEVAREKARAEGRAIRSPWRDAPEGDLSAPHVIRFKGPLDGETVVNDLVKGPVTFKNIELDDLVLLRADGAPTYNLAVVVDDHDMGVTHVIRGDDHLNNAARQTLIYQAMDWVVPAFAHIPLIHGPDGAKLSKRHGAQAVGEFADLGYIPEGMRNYLARLGWGHGDDEVFTDEQAISWFDVADVVKAPARLDWAKLNHINAQHLRKADDSRLTALALTAAEKRGEPLPADAAERIARTVPEVKEGAKTILELVDHCAFALRTRPLALEEKTQKQLTEETVERLKRLRDQLAAAPAFDAGALETVLKSFAESEGVGFGKFGPALRGILTGGAPAPDLNKTMAALSRDEAIGRLDDALAPRA
ncbi:MAG: glutamate--tRNA ligase [Caulobacter vibrioides]|uniref:Glutamate--tRNA ligase n=1 Tax=Caulobacter vibrioides TaxID=155892 RepID=A0A258D791_CAUVI|nr:MAG: glutamate--tRNA ligase [Caulobacter vibrioides]